MKTGTTPAAADTRPELLVASLVTLMDSYCRCACPCGAAQLAGCVARHLDCIAAHPAADPVLRDTVRLLQAEWATRAAH